MEPRTTSHDRNFEAEDEDDCEEANDGNRLLGFMFGNVDGSGDLDVDYLDEDAKEHLSALADKLGPSLTEIDLSVRARSPSGASDQDYDEKAEDAVDYEDIEEQYEGPEIHATSEEDLLLPKKEYFSSKVSLSTLEHKASVFDEENYDEEDYDKDVALAENSSAGQPDILPGESVEYEPDKDSNVDMPDVGSFEIANSSADTREFQEDEPETEKAEIKEKSGFPLPVLCIEDGMVILRFSEIFGVHQPFRKKDKKVQPRHTIIKDMFKTTDVTPLVGINRPLPQRA